MSCFSLLLIRWRLSQRPATLPRESACDGDAKRELRHHLTSLPGAQFARGPEAQALHQRHA